MAISATIIANDVQNINEDMEELGHGPNNFSAPLRDSIKDTATHAGLHLGGRDDKFLTNLQSLQVKYPSLTIREDNNKVFNFSDHVSDRSLEWTDPTLWTENPVMKGDQREFDGVIYTSKIDYNVWTPTQYSRGWEAPEIDNGITVWVQPQGAHDAYQIGDEVTHDNPNDGGNIWVYSSNITANVTEPGRDGRFDRWWKPVRLERSV